MYDDDTLHILATQLMIIVMDRRCRFTQQRYSRRQPGVDRVSRACYLVILGALESCQSILPKKVTNYQPERNHYISRKVFVRLIRRDNTSRWYVPLTDNPSNATTISMMGKGVEMSGMGDWLAACNAWTRDDVHRSSKN